MADFAYFFFGTGIGGGLILNHQVYRGGSRNAGEFGHSSVLPDGPECYCGNRGCLERLVNPTAIVAEVHRRLAAGSHPDSALARTFAEDPDAVDHAAIRVAAAAGDPVAAAVIDETAEYVASVAVDIANFLDVDLIILGGHGIQHVEARYVAVVAAALKKPAAVPSHPGGGGRGFPARHGRGGGGQRGARPARHVLPASVGPGGDRGDARRSAVTRHQPTPHARRGPRALRHPAARRVTSRHRAAARP